MDSRKKAVRGPWVVLPNGEIVSWVNGGGNAKVVLQDQVTEPVENYLSQNLNSVTIASPITILDKDIDLDPGHSFVIGDYFEFDYVDDTQTPVDTYGFQGQVTNVVGDTITVDTPISRTISDLSKVENSNRTNINMNVNGSVTPVRFDYMPIRTDEWDITVAHLDMICASQPADSLWGDRAALTNGVYFGAEVLSGSTIVAAVYGVNLKDNGDLRLSGYDLDYTERNTPPTVFGVAFRKRLAGQQNYGVAFRINNNQAPLTMRFVSYVQDDLTTLTRQRIKIFGHQGGYEEPYEQ